MEKRQMGRLSARIVSTAGQGGPVVVLMHGFGAPGDDLVGLVEPLDAPPGTRFVFPEAPLSLEMGGFGGRAWWMIDMERYQTAIMTGRARDLAQETPAGLPAARAAVIELLDEVEKYFGVNSEKVILGGFSQGAMLTVDVTLATKRPLAGLILFSGSILAEAEWAPKFAARKGLKVVQSHGIMDPILPFFGAEYLKDKLNEAGWLVQWVPFMGMHQIHWDGLRAASALIRSA